MTEKQSAARQSKEQEVKPSSKKSKPKAAPQASAPTKVPIGAIKIEGANRRDLGDLDGLATSIKELGVVTSLTVDEHLNLISGHRRLAAAAKAGLAEVPVVMLDLKNRWDFLLARLAENTHRENPDPLEAGEVLRELKLEYEKEHPETRRGATGGGKNGVGTRSKTDVADGDKPAPRFRTAVAEKLGVSESTIAGWLQTAELPEDKKQLIRDAGAELRRKVAHQQLKQYRSEKRTAKSPPADEANLFRQQYEKVAGLLGHANEQICELAAVAERLQAQGVDIGSPPAHDNLRRYVDSINSAAAKVQALWSASPDGDSTAANESMQTRGQVGESPVPAPSLSSEPSLAKKVRRAPPRKRIAAVQTAEAVV